MSDPKYSETIAFLKEKTSLVPVFGIILGTGLGGLVKEINIETIVPYAEIPHFPVITVESHSGQLIFGKIGEVPVVAMQGRFHFYEGYSMQQVTYPVRIFKLLGITTLLISNACGSVNLSYKKGDLMIIEDHINLQSSNPLIGPHDLAFGTRFPDMSQPYDLQMIHSAWNIAKQEKIRIHKGVYAAVNGPNLETRAEYRFLRNIGADVVGMSTVPEVIVGVQMELKIFAVSIVTDECDPENLKPITLAEILEVAAAAEPNMTLIMKKLITGNK